MGINNQQFQTCNSFQVSKILIFYSNIYYLNGKNPATIANTETKTIA